MREPCMKERAIPHRSSYLPFDHPRQWPIDGSAVNRLMATSADCTGIAPTDPTPRRVSWCEMMTAPATLPASAKRPMMAPVSSPLTNPLPGDRGTTSCRDQLTSATICGAEPSGRPFCQRPIRRVSRMLAPPCSRCSSAPMKQSCGRDRRGIKKGMIPNMRCPKNARFRYSRSDADQLRSVSPTTGGVYLSVERRLEATNLIRLP
jgi:hypothetical protein